MSWTGRGAERKVKRVFLIVLDSCGAGALPDALYHLNKITRIQAMILYLLLDTGATALGLLCVDYFMDSVSATGISVFVVSLLFALVDIPNHPKERRRTR